MNVCFKSIKYKTAALFKKQDTSDRHRYHNTNASTYLRSLCKHQFRTQRHAFETEAAVISFQQATTVTN